MFVCRSIVAALAVVSCLLVGCPSQGAVTPIPDADAQGPPTVTAPVVDAAPAPSPSDVCAAACMNLKAFGCPEAETPDGGRSCLQVCAHENGGKVFDLHPDCVAAAKTPMEIRTCGPTCALGAAPPPAAKK